MRQHLLDYIDCSKTHSVRGLRILLEYFYALETFEPLHLDNLHVVSVFGSARMKPEQKEYKDAQKLGEQLYENGFAVVTGASQGIMGAANEGVTAGIIKDLKKRPRFKGKTDAQIRASREFKTKLKYYSLGLKITLPFEPDHNEHLGVVATFHYFMVRKFFFAALSSAFIACEGGWGTRDELFEVLTLVQTGKMPLMPIIYISPDPRHLTDDIKYALKKKYISPQDVDLVEIVSDYKKAVKIITRFYSVVKKISYDSKPHVEVYLVKPLTAAQKKIITKLVETQYKENFSGGVSFHKGKFVLKNYNYRSYGIVRKIIDAVSPKL